MVKEFDPTVTTRKVAIHTPNHGPEGGTIFWGNISVPVGQHVVGTEVRPTEEGGGGIQCVIYLSDEPVQPAISEKL